MTRVVRFLSIAFVGACALGACESPPFALRFRLTDGDSKACYSMSGGNQATRCDDIKICDAVLSVRIVPPNDPTVPYISMCRPLIGAQDTLCSIATIDLPTPAVPVSEQVLEVQMAVFARDQLRDPVTGELRRDPVTNELICPIVEYGAADGLPVTSLSSCTEQEGISCPVVPAIGGRTYYYPGDEKTVVTLGCTDLETQLQGVACTGENPIQVYAKVNEFNDPNVSVGGSTPGTLTVSIGEPKLANDVYTLMNSDVLDLVPALFPPSWVSEINNVTFTSAKCIDVLENVPQATASVACSRVKSTDATRIDETGYRLTRKQLGDILMALNGNTTFPDEGLVVGIVMSSSLTPVAGATVTATLDGTNYEVKYLANDGTTNATSTGTSGIFMSKVAPFGSTFTWNTGALAQEGFGGLVQNKVTIVVIRENTGTGG